MNASPDPAVTGIIAALEFEARSARLLAQRGWQVRVSGVGPARARAAAEQMLAAGVRRLLVWGTAGGLNPEPSAGTLFLPDVILDAATGTRQQVSAGFHQQLQHSLQHLEVPLIRGGALLSVAQPLITSREKRQAAEATGALMVDMEAAAIAAAATQAGAEFAVLRVLLDTAGTRLPPVVIAAMDTARPHLKVITGLLRRPQDLPAVMHLGQAFRHAHRSLLAAAQALTE